MPFEQHPTDPNKVIMRAGKYKIQKPWVGLTEEEIVDISQHYTEAEGFRHGAEWANAKLKEKNT